MNRHYFLRGKHIASAKPTAVFVHGKMQVPYGRAFFCPICAEVWLLAPVDSQECFAHHVLCDRHNPTPTRRAGSVFLPFEDEWNQDLPTELLVMEFLLQMSIKDKKDGR